jgi:hypothetical protein
LAFSGFARQFFNARLKLGSARKLNTASALSGRTICSKGRTPRSNAAVSGVAGMRKTLLHKLAVWQSLNRLINRSSLDFSNSVAMRRRNKNPLFDFLVLPSDERDGTTAFQ